MISLTSDTTDEVGFGRHAATINQSIKFLWGQYTWQSHAQRRSSWISVQQQNRRNSFTASTGCRVCWYLKGEGQAKEMCLQMFLEGSNWNGWKDRHQQVVPKRWGTRVETSCTTVGLDPRDWQTNSFASSQWISLNLLQWVISYL